MSIRPYNLWQIALFSFACCFIPIAAHGQGRAQEMERAKQLNKLQFIQNFKNLQVNSQTMMHEHEDGSLTSARLNKITRAINKNAKLLRQLIALGGLAEEPEQFEKNIKDQRLFDQSIRKLYQLIFDFSHNPVHQSNKVFNTKAATKAQTELRTIIELSKLIESQSRDYTPVLSLKPNTTH